jgi:ssDNA-binding Zn-finger/Zn-ribbon topoisomerase 1
MITQRLDRQNIKLKEQEDELERLRAEIAALKKPEPKRRRAESWECPECGGELSCRKGMGGEKFYTECKKCRFGHANYKGK